MNIRRSKAFSNLKSFLTNKGSLAKLLLKLSTCSRTIYLSKTNLILAYIKNLFSKFQFLFQVVSVLVSAYTLVAISIDRYMAIMWPLRPRLSKTTAKLLILAVWLVALMVSFPIAMVSKLSQPSSRYQICDRYMCGEVWPSAQHK